MNIDESVARLWSEKIDEFYNRESMFVFKKFKNKNWRWYKFWKKRYVYDLVKNPKFGKQYN